MERGAFPLFLLAAAGLLLWHFFAQPAEASAGGSVFPNPTGAGMPSGPTFVPAVPLDPSDPYYHTPGSPGFMPGPPLDTTIQLKMPPPGVTYFSPGPSNRGNPLDTMNGFNVQPSSNFA